MSEERAKYVAAARARAFLLYEGRHTPHRSCGIALAETFALPTLSYQALRRGGITGEGTCGAVLAGQLVLGEILGDPEPTGPVTPELREAVARYRATIRGRLDHAPDTSCNDRTAGHGPFPGVLRHGYCTALAADVAAAVAEVLWDLGRARPHPPPPEAR
jgi:hypothetical protein